MVPRGGDRLKQCWTFLKFHGQSIMIQYQAVLNGVRVTMTFSYFLPVATKIVNI